MRSRRAADLPCIEMNELIYFKVPGVYPPSSEFFLEINGFKKFFTRHAVMLCEAISHISLSSLFLLLRHQNVMKVLQKDFFLFLKKEPFLMFPLKKSGKITQTVSNNVA